VRNKIVLRAAIYRATEMKSTICCPAASFVLGLISLLTAQDGPAPLRSAEEWERLGAERAQREHEQEYLPRSRSVNSWRFYNLAYGVDGNLAFFEATGNKEYLDRALTYAENCVASAQPSRSLPASQFKDDYLAWPATDHPQSRSIAGGEYPLYESYCWRYVTRTLRVMRQTPVIWADENYRRRYAALLDFTEKHIFDKWHSRGENHLYRSRTHMASHWAYIALELSLLTGDADRKAKCIQVYSKINSGTPGNGSSLRGQLAPHRSDKSAYFWSSQWGSKDPPGQDVSHGNNMVAYVVEAHDLGVEFTKEDIAAFSALLLNMLWKPDGAGDRFAAFVDGSGKGNGWFNDGFMKLGRYNAEIQKRLESHTVGRGVQFYGNGALNAHRLLTDRAQAPGSSDRATAGPLFREDWRETPAETPLSQSHVANTSLTVALYGTGAKEIKKSHHTQPADDPYYVWSGQASGSWAVTLRHLKGPLDLRGDAKVRWRSRQSGPRQLRLVLKLADGAWLVSEQSDAESQSWREYEFLIASQRWRKLDLVKIMEGAAITTPDLTRV
jgi:hypothetical protein